MPHRKPKLRIVLENSLSTIESIIFPAASRLREAASIVSYWFVALNRLGVIGTAPNACSRQQRSLLEMPLKN
jgi:hypothetical protein